MSTFDFKHHILTTEERVNFVKIYEQVEKNHPVYTFIKKSKYLMYLWLLYIIIIQLLAVWYYFKMSKFELYNFGSAYWHFFKILLGIFAFQLFFIISHMTAHALFLEYDNHDVQSDKMPNEPVYYFAFYHHHHTETDDWAPFLGYNPKYNSYVSLLDNVGIRNVTFAHWYSYTMMVYPRLYIALGIVLLYPPMCFYLIGYELGVILLPLAHGWQHIPNHNFSSVTRYVFGFLEYVGVLAKKHDHSKHHVHNSPTVYQDFSSSGLYLKRLDDCFNKLWNVIFNYSKNNGKIRPFDIFKIIFFSTFLFLFGLIPAFFYCYQL